MGGSPFAVFVAPAAPHAPSSGAQGAGLLLARAGEEARLLLTSHDLHGNRQWHRRLPPGVWHVELQGPATLAASITPLPCGRSEARYTANPNPNPNPNANHNHKHNPNPN